MLFSEDVCQFLHYLCVRVSSWLDDAHEELWRNAKPQNTIDESPHDLQMEQSLEKLLEIMLAHIHHLHVQVLQVKLQLSLQLKVLSIQTFVMSELLTLEAIFLHHFDVIDSLLLHAHNSP